MAGTNSASVIPMLHAQAGCILELVQQTTLCQLPEVLSILEQLIYSALKYLEQQPGVPANLPLKARRERLLGSVTDILERASLDWGWDGREQASSVKREPSPVLTAQVDPSHTHLPMPDDIQQSIENVTEQPGEHLDQRTTPHLLSTQQVQKSDQADQAGHLEQEADNHAMEEATPSDFPQHQFSFSSHKEKSSGNEDSIEDKDSDGDDGSKNISDDDQNSESRDQELTIEECKKECDQVEKVPKRKTRNERKMKIKKTTIRIPKLIKNKMSDGSARKRVLKSQNKSKKKAGSEEIALETCTEIVIEKTGSREKTQQGNPSSIEKKLGRLASIKQKMKADLKGQFECPLCEISRPEVLYKRHILLKHCREDHFQPDSSGRLVWHCWLCDTTIYDHGINSISRALNHLNRKHERPIPESYPIIQCPDCPFTTVSFKTLKEHVRFCTKQKDMCSVCGKMMYTGSLKRHMATVHNQERTKKYPCSICDKMFFQKKDVSIHHARFHSDDRGYLCSVCPRQFATKPDLQNHMFTKHDTKVDVKKIFICNICGYETIRGNIYRQHMKIHSEDKPHICEICGKSFKTAAYLGEHMRRHNSVKNIHCTRCDFATTVRDYLDKHMRIHRGERHSCQQCNYSTVFKENLNKHVRLVHKDVGVTGGGGHPQEFTMSYEEMESQVQLLAPLQVSHDPHVATATNAQVTSMEELHMNPEFVTPSFTAQLLY